MIKLSLDDLIKLYKQASIGKLVGGLIHNLNGPMQNLGLDIEMASYSLKDKTKWDQNLIEAIISRLKRMEAEHDRINSLIRSTSERTEDRHAEDDIMSVGIHDFINQELSYLDANLYFKHNVQKEVININGLCSISTLPKYSLTALCWFLQCLAEELERQKVTGLTIKILSENSNLKIMISTQGGELSEGFIGQLKNTVSSGNTMKSDNTDMGIFLVLQIFNSNGITFGFNAESSSYLEIYIPYR